MLVTRYAAFGVRVGSLDGDVAFQSAFDAAQVQCFHRFLRPIWKLHPTELTNKKNVKIVREFASGIVAARKEAAKTSDLSGRKDLLSLFISAGVTDDDYLSDFSRSFIIAGRDTTAQAMSWAVHLLIQHPTVEQRMREEIDRELMTKAKGEFTYDIFRKLVYTQAVVHETLRLYPSVPKDGVYAVKDDVLPDGTPVKAGTMVIFPPYAMGRNPNLWENPLVFDPSRWLAADGESIIKVSPFKYCVFKAGPRICLGMNMAILESTCVLAYIYARFRFEMAPNAPEVNYINSLTLPMKNGLHVRVLKRD